MNLFHCQPSDIDATPTHEWLFSSDPAIHFYLFSFHSRGKFASEINFFHIYYLFFYFALLIKYHLPSTSSPAQSNFWNINFHKTNFYLDVQIWINLNFLSQKFASKNFHFLLLPSFLLRIRWKWTYFSAEVLNSKKRVLKSSLEAQS